MILIVIFLRMFSSEQIPLVLCCEINNKVCFQRENDVIIPVYSEYSARQSRMLGIHSVYSRIEIATRSKGYSGLFHLFLFRNKVNRTHP